MRRMLYNRLMQELSELVSGHGLGALLNHVHAMIMVVQKDGTLISWNRAFQSSRPDFSPASKLQQFVTSADREEIQKRLNSPEEQHWLMDFVTSTEEQPVQCDCLLIPLNNGQLLFIADRIEADTTLAEIVQRLNKQVKLFQVERDVANKLAHRKHTEVEAVLAQAHEVSQMDVLTFLPNRRMILRELQDEVLRAERYHTQFSISLVDVDHFKKVNDSYGHLTGDEVLRQVGSKLKEQIRHPDLAGRYGGEEFLILLPNSNATAAAEQAARLCRQVRDTVVQAHDHVLQVTISIGIAEFEYGVDTWESLLNRADAALYSAKSGGRDRWSVAG
jgi:diguanylate cyclase (GGDEF)-like protein